jgi:hypothetical protein
MSNPDLEAMRIWHERLAIMRTGLISAANDRFPKGVSSDTIFAIGQLIGQIDKAKALMGRDIDEARR